MANQEIRNGLKGIDGQQLAKVLGQNLLSRTRAGEASPLSLFTEQYPEIVAGIVRPVQDYADERGYGIHEIGELTGIVLATIMSLEQTTDCRRRPTSPPESS